MSDAPSPPPPVPFREVYLYRRSADPEVVPTEVISASPSTREGGRSRWVIVRLTESLHATGDESLALLLAQLNSKLAQLRSLLADPLFADYIVGFNRLENPNPKRPPFEAPTALLLTLLGAPTGVPLDDDKWRDPATYPSPRPAWITDVELFPTPSYANWLSVFDRVRSAAEGRKGDAACDIVEASLHLIREAVVFETDRSIDLCEYGSSIVLEQYQRRARGDRWVTERYYVVRDYMPRELPPPHDNAPRETIGRSSVTWSVGNTSTALIRSATARTLVQPDDHRIERFAAGSARPARYIYSANGEELVKRMGLETSSWSLEESRDAVLDLFLSEPGRYRPRRLDSLSAPITLSRGSVYLVVDVIENSPHGPWAPPRTARSDADGLRSTAQIPGVLIYMHAFIVVASAALEKPLAPRPAPLRLSDPDERRGTEMASPVPDWGGVSAYEEFSWWTLPEFGGPEECRWISAVIHNRIRAALVARFCFLMPFRPEEWPAVGTATHPSNLPGHGRNGFRLLQLASASGSPSFDAVVVDGPNLGDLTVGLFPGLLERRPFFGTDGRINYTWLRECYELVYGASWAKKSDRQPNGQVMFQECARYYLRNKLQGNSASLQWYYWRLRRLGSIGAAPQLYPPIAGLEESLWSSTAELDYAMHALLERRVSSRLAPPRESPVVFIPEEPEPRRGGVTKPGPAAPPRPVLPVVIVEPEPLAAPPAAPEPPRAPGGGAPTATPPVTVDLTDLAKSRRRAEYDALYADYQSLLNEYNRVRGHYRSGLAAVESAQEVIDAALLGLAEPWDAPPGDTPSGSIKITARLAGEAREALERATRRLAATIAAEGRASVRFAEELARAPWYAALRQAHNDARYTYVDGAPVTWATFSSALEDPRQRRTVDTLQSSAQRATVATDRETLERLAGGLRQQLAASLEEVGIVERSLASGDAVGEALLVRMEQTQRATRRPSFEVRGVEWPATDRDIEPALAAELARATSAWSSAMRAAYEEILRQQVDTFVSTMGTIQDVLTESVPPGSRNSILTRSKLQRVRPPAETPTEAVLIFEYAPNRGAALEFLADAIREEPSDAASVFDRIRKRYLDCAVIAGSEELGGDRGATWLKLQKAFRAIKERAAVVEDYFRAFVDMVAGESGWCAYARKRHYLYVPDDPINFELVGGDTYRWRSKTRWNGSKLPGGSAAAPGEPPEAGNVRVSRAEAEMLRAVEALWRRMWAAAMIEEPVRSDNPGGAKLASPELRFVQLGTTLEECVERLERDGLIYRAIVGDVLPVMGGIDSPAKAYQLVTRICAAMLGVRPLPLPGLALASVDVDSGVAAALKRIDAARLAVGKVLTEGLPALAIWSSPSHVPPNWWHGGSSAHIAYEYSRPMSLLTPSGTDADDDMHGATIAVTEFLAIGKPGVWDRFNSKGTTPVTRPTCAQIVEASVAASARRHRDAAKRGDSASFAKWVTKVWRAGNYSAPMCIAMGRTFGRMTAMPGAAEGLALMGDLGRQDFAPNWALSERFAPIGADKALAEGYALVKALAAEVGSLVYGAAEPTVALGGLLLRAESRALGPLGRALDMLLRALVTGKVDAAVPSLEQALRRMASWVSQSSATASTRALPNPAAPAQWTQVVGLLSGREYLPPGATAFPAEERLAGAALPSETETARLVGELEGAPELPGGTRFLPPATSKPLYDIDRFNNALVAEAGEAALHRVAWPTALAQCLRSNYTGGGGGSGSDPKEERFTLNETLSFIYSTVARNDANERPLPFFAASLPEAPGRVRYGGFSAEAIADYCASSAARVELDAIDSRGPMVRLFSEFEQALRGSAVADTTVFMERMLVTGNVRPRFILVAGGNPLEGYTPAGVWSAPQAPYIGQRGAMAFLREATSTALSRDSTIDRWRVLSAWVPEVGREPAEGSKFVSLTPVELTMEQLAALTEEQARNLYLNPIHPVTGRPEKGSLVRSPSSYVRWRRESPPPEASTKRLDMSVDKMAILNLVDFGTVLIEKSAATDWYKTLAALDPDRRLRSDYVAVLNGDGSLLGALSTFTGLDSGELDRAKRALKERWDAFAAKAVLLFARLKGVLGTDVDAFAELHKVRLELWNADWSIVMLKVYDKSKTKIEKALGSSASSDVVRGRIRDAVDAYTDADKSDERKRQGWLATLVGIHDEAGARSILQRLLALGIVSESVRSK